MATKKTPAKKVAPAAKKVAPVEKPAPDKIVQETPHSFDVVKAVEASWKKNPEACAKLVNDVNSSDAVEVLCARIRYGKISIDQLPS